MIEADPPAPFQPVGKKKGSERQEILFHTLLQLTFHGQELNHMSPLARQAGKHSPYVDII